MSAANAFCPWIAEAEAHARESPFEVKFRSVGCLLELHASGEAAGHGFGASSGPFMAQSVEQVVGVIDELIVRMRTLADRFHRALAIPFLAFSEQRSLSATEQIDRSIEQYKGCNLAAISVPPELLIRLCAERGLAPGDGDSMIYRGVPLILGSGGLRYILED